MPVYLAQVTIPDTSGLARDARVNTWHVQADTEPLSADFAGQCTAFRNFYQAMSGSWSNRVATTGNSVKFYDLSDPKPRVPVYEGNLGTLTVSASDTGPLELCLCISFQGTPVSGVPQARKRGRIYLGPLSKGTIGYDRPQSALRSAMASAASTLLAASLDTGAGALGVWSGVANAFTPYTGGWIDDEWDIQRRRGQRPTTRTTFS